VEGLAVIMSAMRHFNQSLIRLGCSLPQRIGTICLVLFFCSSLTLLYYIHSCTLHIMQWRHIVYGHNTISILWGKMAYCVLV